MSEYRQPLDSRIEEWIASHRGFGWFDSRRSGDIAGYVHKTIWVSATALVALVLGQPAWWGAATYTALYLPIKLYETWHHWLDWKAGWSKLGPWRDLRKLPGVNFGFVVDGVLDLLVAFGATALVWWLA